MPLTVDTSELQALQAQLTAMMQEQVPQILKSVVDLGAAYARNNHEYINRTGDLTKSTKGIWMKQTRSQLQRNLDVGMQYASYVRNRGLMEVDHAASQIEQELQEQFGGLKL
jgi:hypothetical protein